ncbi:hypothetical protein ACJX0J_012213, partial [Zea mays]
MTRISFQSIILYIYNMIYLFMQGSPTTVVHLESENSNVNQQKLHDILVTKKEQEGANYKEIATDRSAIDIWMGFLNLQVLH